MLKTNGKPEQFYWLPISLPRVISSGNFVQVSPLTLVDEAPTRSTDPNHATILDTHPDNFQDIRAAGKRLVGKTFCGQV